MAIIIQIMATAMVMDMAMAIQMAWEHMGILKGKNIGGH